MKEKDQYKIELDHDDIEQVLTEWAEKKLAEKGYHIDYRFREPGQFYPTTLFRGVRIEAK